MRFIGNLTVTYFRWPLYERRRRRKYVRRKNFVHRKKIETVLEKSNMRRGNYKEKKLDGDELLLQLRHRCALLISRYCYASPCCRYTSHTGKFCLASNFPDLLHINVVHHSSVYPQ